MVGQYPDTRRPRQVFIASLFLSATAGLSWMFGLWGPVLSLLLIPLVLAQRTRLARFSVAFAYYLAGSHGIPLASAVFFGPGRGHWIEGVALWLVSSVLLASGWTFANTGGKAVVVLLLDALTPPLAFFDWMSPLAAAGVLFPGTAAAGILFLLSAVYIGGNWLTNRWPAPCKGPADAPWRLLHGVAVIALVMTAAIANLVTVAIPPSPPKGWLGLDLHIGPSSKSVATNFQHMDRWMAAACTRHGADRHPRAKVILLPETLLTWWAGNAADVQAHVPPGQTWLVGASIPLKRGYFADGIEAVTRHHSEMVFASALPVPVSMWRPWHKPSGDSFGLNNYRAFWLSPTKTIDGKRVWASICYDQLLPFSWMEASLYQPQVILLTNNEWWARGTGIPQIQKASGWAWARLTGAVTIEAENA